MVQRQSKYVIAPLLWRGAAVGMAIFAPFEHCTGGGGGSWPVVVTLEGGGMVPGGEAGGRAGSGCWQAIPPFAPIWLGRYVGLVSRNFFSSFGSPRSAVLADSDCVSCCVCVNTEMVDK